MKRLAILGSTGSVGTSTLRVVDEWPDRLSVVALAAGRQSELLKEQIRRFRPSLVSLADEAAARRLREELADPGLRILSGPAGLRAVACESGADLVVSSLVGAIGLEPTLGAIEAGIDVALANKETLVMAGELMTQAALRTGSRLLPVDSEHAALHQILEGREPAQVTRLVLTASGGPFRRASLEALRVATLEQALKHPTWSMGDKITIDSATLANKGLEVIEARWLFGFTADRIDVLVHPQSIVHALVEFVDGTFLAQLGVTDMRSPIQYALGYPERWVSHLAPLGLAELGALEFEHPDVERFPCLGLALAAARAGGLAPCVFNAANEIGNAAFRERKLDFMGIPATIEHVLDELPSEPVVDLAGVLESDRRARESASRFIHSRQGA